MKAKKLFPDLSIKRLWDKIKELEDKVGDGSVDKELGNKLQWYVDMRYLPEAYSPIITALVPLMSGFNDINGNVSLSQSCSSHTDSGNTLDCWRAFDDQHDQLKYAWSPVSGTKEFYMDITFARDKVVEYCEFTACSNTNGNVVNITLLSSDDGKVYEEIGKHNHTTASNSRTWKAKILCDVFKARKYYRFLVKSSAAIGVTGSYAGYIDDLQLYGY